eukprot:scaffold1484_cov173-Amphora_coffeaeformis.AAC.10
MKFIFIYHNGEVLPVGDSLRLLEHISYFEWVSDVYIWYHTPSLNLKEKNELCPGKNLSHALSKTSGALLMSTLVCACQPPRQSCRQGDAIEEYIFS